MATLRAAALIETVSYCILLSFWVAGNDIGTQLFGRIRREGVPAAWRGPGPAVR